MSDEQTKLPEFGIRGKHGAYVYTRAKDSTEAIAQFRDMGVLPNSFYTIYRTVER